MDDPDHSFDEERFVSVALADIWEWDGSWSCVAGC